MHQKRENEDKAHKHGGLGLRFCLVILVCIVTFIFGLSHLPILDSLQTLPNGSRILRQPRRAPGFEYQEGDLVFELAKVIRVQIYCNDSTTQVVSLPPLVAVNKTCRPAKLPAR